jgi:hypothetical protein
MEYIVTVKCTAYDETELQEFRVAAVGPEEAIDKAMELAQENGSEECEYEYDLIREA